MSARKRGNRKLGGVKPTHQEEIPEQVAALFTPPAAPFEDTYNVSLDIGCAQPSTDNNFDIVNVDSVGVMPNSQREPLSCLFDDLSSFTIPDKRAQEQLAIFRDRFLPNFPFVFIPSNTNSSDLRHQRQFLWFVIMSLTTSSADEQSAMGNIIRRVISQRIVGEHEKDLELLLGLICYLAW